MLEANTVGGFGVALHDSRVLPFILIVGYLDAIVGCNCSVFGHLSCMLIDH